jgi:hypothetical protein
MVTTTWIMANIYRAVIITEFSNTVCTFGHGARPRDLLPDEWPSFSPCVRGPFPVPSLYLPCTFPVPSLYLLPDEWPSFSPCVRGHFGSHFSASVSLARRSAQARSAHH